MKYYAGIGSRKTPQDILEVMTKIADKLTVDKYILRSGGAIGADKAFESGAFLANDIYYANDASASAIEMASQFHPAWDKCNAYVRKLHGRNCHIILGCDLKTPVDFVFCWTPGAKVTGGTGLGMRIALEHGISVRNLADSETLKRTKAWLKL